MAELKNIKGISEKDRAMIIDAEVLLGPEPSTMGVIKNLFWGNLRTDLLFPYPKQTTAEEQKARWLPHLAKEWLSAFCLSEPDVGCDAGGQRTRCELSADGQHYILNGEKKWATSGALSGLFTVMCKQQVKDPKSGKTSE